MSKFKLKMPNEIQNPNVKYLTFVIQLSFEFFHLTFSLNAH